MCFGDFPCHVLFGCKGTYYFTAHVVCTLVRVERMVLLQSLASVPYLFGHFPILSFFHVFRLSAYHSLVPVYVLGSMACSFPFGCNEYEKKFMAL